MSVYVVVLENLVAQTFFPSFFQKNKGKTSGHQWEKRGSGGFTPPTNLPIPRGETPERLFNLKDDPSENNNVSYKFPKKLEQLKKKLDSIKHLNSISYK